MSLIEYILSKKDDFKDELEANLLICIMKKLLGNFDETLFVQIFIKYYLEINPFSFTSDF